MGQGLTKRQKDMLGVIVAAPYSTLSELADLFDISESTVRRELKALDQKGLINMVTGMVVMGKDAETSFEARKTRLAELKTPIALEAVRFVGPSDSIYIGGGSTMFQFASALAKENDLTGTTVITSTINIARCFQRRYEMRVILAGGYFKDENETMQSYMTTDLLKTFNYHKAFLSCAAFSEEFGIMHTSPELAQVERVVINSSREIIALVDASKVGQLSTLSICPVERVTRLITNRNADEEALEKIRAKGVEVILA